MFAFVRAHQFSANDFIRIKDAHGSIRLGSNLLRVAIAECVPSRSIVDDAARAMIALILASRRSLTHPVDFAARHSVADALGRNSNELIAGRQLRGSPDGRFMGRLNFSPKGKDWDR